jgi:hypothetical protein
VASIHSASSVSGWPQRLRDLVATTFDLDEVDHQGARVTAKRDDFRPQLSRLFPRSEKGKAVSSVEIRRVNLLMSPYSAQKNPAALQQLRESFRAQATEPSAQALVGNRA